MNSDTRDPRLSVFLRALALMVGGTLTSFVTYLIVRPMVIGVLEPGFPAVSTLLSSKLSQLGFAVFLCLYFAKTDRWREFVRVRRPDRYDLLWIVLGAAALDLIESVLVYVLPVLGFSMELLSTGGMGVGLETFPVLWPLVFLGLYLLPALVEEQFYRGLLQEYLDTEFHPVTTIVLGALLYSLSHALYGIGQGPEFLAAYLIYLFGIGLAFCLTYHRTRNVLVVAVVHAQSWAAVDFPFFGLL